MRSRKNFARKGQEARLYIACAAAIVFPVSMFIYAWTASPHIHWIVPLIGLTVRPRQVIPRQCSLSYTGLPGIYVWRFCNIPSYKFVCCRLVGITILLSRGLTRNIPSYGTYASSAQAGLSLARGFAFPICYSATLMY